MKKRTIVQAYNEGYADGNNPNTDGNSEIWLINNGYTARQIEEYYNGWNKGYDDYIKWCEELNNEEWNGHFILQTKKYPKEKK